MGTYNFTWTQGEDLSRSFIYKVGESSATAVPVDLTGYSLRMDVVKQGATARIYTLNSEALTDPLDETTEVVLGAEGEIDITISRAVTLQGGELFDALSSGTAFAYDIFLRDPSGKQKKILAGTITVDTSITLWA